MANSLSRSLPSGCSSKMGDEAAKYPMLTVGRYDTVQGTWALALDVSEFESQLRCLLTSPPWRNYITCLSISYKMSRVDMWIRENVDKAPSTQQVVTFIGALSPIFESPTIIYFTSHRFWEGSLDAMYVLPKCYPMVPQVSEQVNTIPNMPHTSRD